MRNACFNMIYELAKRDDRVVFIGSDLSPGLLDDMKQEMPDRFFMEGISEANLVGMAAGMAFDGYIPFVVTIGTFMTRRCYEQIAVDVCLHNLPVNLVGIGCGLNYAPLGPTHQAIEDISILRALPNMTIVAPCDADEMNRLMSQILDWPHPTYIRLAKGYDPIVSKEELGFKIGKAIVVRQTGEKKDNVLLISTGVMTTRALAAAEIHASKGIDCTVIHAHTVKPLDQELIVEHARRARCILTIEEHTVVGGFGSACTDTLVEQVSPKELPLIRRIGIPDCFVDDYGDQDSLMESLNMHPEGIANRVLELA